MQINKKKQTNPNAPSPLHFLSNARLHEAFSGHRTGDLSLLFPFLLFYILCLATSCLFLATENLNSTGMGFLVSLIPIVSPV